MTLAEILDVAQGAADLITTLGIMPYVFAGAIAGLVGYLIKAAKKVGR